MIEAFCQQEQGRAQARALLELFWTDIAANWFPPVQRLADAHSRTYDFLRGLGYLDVQLTLNGWLEPAATKELDAIYGAQAETDHIRIQVAGVTGTVGVNADAPRQRCGELSPTPSRAVLEVDGEDVGRTILQEVPSGLSGN